MAKLFERMHSTLTISEFYNNYVLDRYNFEASYQRKSRVWSDDSRSFLIDSIMKNYPIPPIFLRPCVNNETGKTVYDVVDGKQRLESIIGFIKGEVSLPKYFADGFFVDEASLERATKIAGKKFEEIKIEGEEFSDYIKEFWTYALTVEYIYEDNEGIVASAFDRLNRNGEPLTGQELRNAKYASSKLLIEIKQLSEDSFWDGKNLKLKIVRMENEEFVSELFFVVMLDRILDSSQDELDKLYEEFRDNEEMISKAKQKMLDVFSYIDALDIDFSRLKCLRKPTHFYSLFTFAWKVKALGVPESECSNSIHKFYSNYDSRNTVHEGEIQEYKDASSSRTRSKNQRENRLKALLKFCNIQNSTELNE